MLRPTPIKITHIGDTRVADHGSYSVRVEVTPREVHETDMGPIKAVARLHTEPPRQILAIFGRAV